MVLFQGRAVTHRAQLPEVDSSSSLALSLNTKARALSRGTGRDRHDEEATGHSWSIRDDYTLGGLCGWILFISSPRHKVLYGRDSALVSSVVSCEELDTDEVFTEHVDRRDEGMGPQPY